MPVMKKQKGQNEIKLKQLLEETKTKYYEAIKKEIDNNIKTGAYEILSPEEPEEVRRAGHNILQSRYVLVEKRIEAEEVPATQEEGLLVQEDEHGGFKAKASHAMKGFSEPDSEWLEAATPQVAPETVLLILQTICSSRWTPGYLDFTQAFHSGDPISRLLFAEVPPEGIPGVQERQLLKLKKHCYGLLDGPYQWYVHQQKILTQLGYEQSQADPCLYLLFDTPESSGRDEDQERRLEGIIGVATDDLIHGGGPRHWRQMEWIQQHYKGQVHQRRWTLHGGGDQLPFRWKNQSTTTCVRSREDQADRDLKRKKRSKVCTMHARGNIIFENILGIFSMARKRDKT